jgi:hypothetical protein
VEGTCLIGEQLLLNGMSRGATALADDVLEVDDEGAVVLLHLKVSTGTSRSGHSRSGTSRSGRSMVGTSRSSALRPDCESIGRWRDGSRHRVVNCW